MSNPLLGMTLRALAQLLDQAKSSIMDEYKTTGFGLISDVQKSLREIPEMLEQSEDQLTDITGALGVEILIKEDGRVLWVNVAGQCRLRICRIEGDIVIRDDRPEPME